MAKVELRRALDEHANEYRDDGHGDYERGEEGEGDRERERDEELRDDPTDQPERQKDRAGRERGGGDGAGDLGGALESGLLRVVAGLHIAVGVLKHDDGVVHHTADRYREAREGENVEGEVVSPGEQKRREDRSREGDRGHQGSAQAPQESEDDGDSQHGPYEALLDDAIDGLRNVGRRVEDYKDLLLAQSIPDLV